MTIDEVIKRCENEAKHNLKSAEKYHHKGESRLEDALHYDAKYKQQLAEWLKELKAYKELNTYNRTNPCSECKHEDSAYNCDYCIWNYVNNFEQKEVKADGDS